MLIKNYTILINSKLIKKTLEHNQKDHIKINIENYPNKIIHTLKIQFLLRYKPIAFRDHDYQWKSCDKLRISNPLSPKILKFSNGNHLMANRYVGTWVYNPAEPYTLEWRLWGPELSPTFHYDDQRLRHWHRPKYPNEKQLEIGIIETTKPVEISRSKIPFSSVLIFTDHCDFDSLNLLQKQREFFKERGIKVTKSFFLHHYSKKGDWNASFENNRDELKKWVDDGHELAYHSLSQSTLKNKAEEIELFSSFKSPELTQVRTWIDHGYQPYNWTMQRSKEEKYAFQLHLFQKSINVAWNYFDVAEATWNLNQNNYKLSVFNKILFSKLKLLDKLRILIYYNGSDNLVAKYRKIAPLVKQGNVIQALKLISNLNFNIGLEDYVKRVQIFFNSDLPNFYFFQTIAVKDWKLALEQPLDNLVLENGVGILHTYFSFTGKHHHNPLFKENSNIINPKVVSGFDKLSRNIQEKNIWNPTLIEFIDFIDKIQNIKLTLINSQIIVEDSNFNETTLIRNTE